MLGSGSRGNAVLLQSGNTRILVDAGFAPRTMALRLAKLAVDPRSIEAVIVTHEHIDHLRGAVAGARKWGWKIVATAGTAGAGGPLPGFGVQIISSGDTFSIGDVMLEAVRTSHDASDPVAVIATGASTGVRAAIVYDLGVMTDAIRRSLERLDILVLESNHDSEMLRNGPYPAMLKRRIAGREGHLSNRAAALAASECAHKGLAHVVLAHLSEVNNTHEKAIESMRGALRRTSFKGVVAASTQDHPMRAVSAGAGSRFEPAQLTLSL